MCLSCSGLHCTVVASKAEKTSPASIYIHPANYQSVATIQEKFLKAAVLQQEMGRLTFSKWHQRCLGIDMIGIQWFYLPRKFHFLVLRQNVGSTFSIFLLVLAILSTNLVVVHGNSPSWHIHHRYTTNCTKSISTCISECNNAASMFQRQSHFIKQFIP